MVDLDLEPLHTSPSCIRAERVVKAGAGVAFVHLETSHHVAKLSSTLCRAEAGMLLQPVCVWLFHASALSFLIRLGSCIREWSGIYGEREERHICPNGQKSLPQPGDRTRVLVYQRGTL